MESDSGPIRTCDRCGGSNDLYLLTLRETSCSRNGNVAIRCAACREGGQFDVSIPLCLVTPRLLLGLQRLRKLSANLGYLLQGVEFG